MEKVVNRLIQVKKKGKIRNASQICLLPFDSLIYLKYQKKVEKGRKREKKEKMSFPDEVRDRSPRA